MNEGYSYKPSEFFLGTERDNRLAAAVAQPYLPSSVMTDTARRTSSMHPWMRLVSNRLPAAGSETPRPCAIRRGDSA